MSEDRETWPTIGRIDLDAMTPEQRSAWRAMFRRVDPVTGERVPVAVILDDEGRFVEQDVIAAERN